MVQFMSRIVFFSDLAFLVLRVLLGPREVRKICWPFQISTKLQINVLLTYKVHMWHPFRKGLLCEIEKGALGIENRWQSRTESSKLINNKWRNLVHNFRAEWHFKFLSVWRKLSLHKRSSLTSHRFHGAVMGSEVFKLSKMKGLIKSFRWWLRRELIQALFRDRWR